MSVINNQTDIYTSPTLEPNFDWQVGFNNFNSISSGVNFRVTVRPLTNLEQFTRIPNSTVLYEETGIVLNGTTNLGLWQFSFDKNLSSTGGPHRDYQVVVEAHDQNGNTSAGNVIGTYGDAENGWTAYANGYDIVAVKNPRPTGIELSNNLPTQNSSTGSFTSLSGNNYSSTQFMGANGEIIIRFNSGNFQSGIVGGFLYTSATQFPKQDIFSPTSFYGSRVEQTRFTFDVNNQFVYCPHAAFNVRGAPYCFASISFFDELDEVLLDRGIDVSTGLYMSDNAFFYNDGAAGSVTMGGNVTFYTVQTTGYPLTGTSLWSGLIGSGSTEIARVSTNGTANISSNITVIYYMTLPITGLYTGYAGGTPGGIGGDSTSNVTGKTPGGFGTGTLIAVGFDSSNNMIFKSITGMKVGDTIISYIFPPLTGTDLPYNSLIDNWQTTHYSLTGLLFPPNVSGNFSSGYITNIGSSIISGYTKIDKGDVTNPLEITFEQPIFMFTGTSTPSFLTGRFIDGKTFYTGVVFKDVIGGSVDAELLQCSNIAGTLRLFREPINETTFPALFGTGRFYYLDTKPYNTFFVTNTGLIIPIGGYLAHNSLYSY